MVTVGDGGDVVVLLMVHYHWFLARQSLSVFFVRSSLLHLLSMLFLSVNYSPPSVLNYFMQLQFF